MKGMGEILTAMALWVGFVFSVLRYRVPTIEAILKRIEGVSQCQIAHFAEALPDFRKGISTNWFCPSNTVTLDLSSAIKYFRIDFLILTINANKVTMFIRSVEKPTLAHLSGAKKPLRTWISEMKELSE